MKGFSLKKHHIIFLAITMVVILIDQVTKWYVDRSMSLHESIPVIGGLFNITYIRNPGAAFGFLATASPAFRSSFLIVVTVTAIVLIIYFLERNKSADELLTVSLSLILGGAVGNLIDRVRLGEVIDFLDVYIASHHWPAFNIADSAISVGAIILIYKMIKRRDASTT